MKSVKRILILFTLFVLPFFLHAKTSKSPVIIEKLKYQKLVNRFYEIKGESIFWYSNGQSVALRQKAKMILDSSVYLGLNKEQYHYKWICANIDDNDELTDSLIRNSADRIFTDALISLCKDLYGGDDIYKLVSYDELSQKFEPLDNTYILMGLSSVSSPIELEWFIRFLEPVSENYISLKHELRNMINKSKADTLKQLSESLNVIRWMKHFNFNRFIVVNTASAILRYYTSDTLFIQMKVVVGKEETPTPRFAGYCDQVILYPYWNVPYSIAVKEMLPLIKRNRNYLNTRNLQVIDKNGRIMDPHSINWSSLSSKYFPYQLRQSTGCDNALGVIKFNLTDPFSVYMHDTNSKTAFLAGARYFSHGCIRLEKPVELATAFLPGKINPDFLEACEKNQKPVPLNLAEPVPVFVVYMTAELNETGAVKYFKDVYDLFR
jgi:L,D-transpeptidase YcbB